MTDTKKRLELTIGQTKEMFQFVGEKVIASKPRLTEIDSAIGDGDHGIGMSVGFKKAIENLNQKELPSINEVFKTIGMSMISSMGGASGIIFGTMFVGGVKGLEEHKTLNLQTLATIFEKSLEAIKTRGKADLGDKTMIDALQPAVLSLNNSNYSDLSEALHEAAAQANAGVERTKEFIAKFGRAKTLGERAIGHQDAGATTVAIIFEAMAEWVEGNVE